MMEIKHWEILWGDKETLEQDCKSQKWGFKVGVKVSSSRARHGQDMIDGQSMVEAP